MLGDNSKSGWGGRVAQYLKGFLLWGQHLRRFHRAEAPNPS